MNAVMLVPIMLEVYPGQFFQASQIKTVMIVSEKNAPQGMEPGVYFQPVGVEENKWLKVHETLANRFVQNLNAMAIQAMPVSPIMLPN